MSVAMRATRSEQTAEALSNGEPSTSSRALVMVAEPMQWSPLTLRYPSPDPTFVTQLIASAEQFTETRNHLGQGAADASSAYRARQARAASATRLRQVI
jgi:hypothetical protein